MKVCHSCRQHLAIERLLEVVKEAFDALERANTLLGGGQIFTDERTAKETIGEENFAETRRKLKALIRKAEGEE